MTEQKHCPVCNKIIDGENEYCSMICYYQDHPEEIEFNELMTFTLSFIKEVLGSELFEAKEKQLKAQIFVKFRRFRRYKDNGKQENNFKTFETGSNSDD